MSPFGGGFNRSTQHARARWLDLDRSLAALLAEVFREARTGFVGEHPTLHFDAMVVAQIGEQVSLRVLRAHSTTAWPCQGREHRSLPGCHWWSGRAPFPSSGSACARLCTNSGKVSASGASSGKM